MGGLLCLVLPWETWLAKEMATSGCIYISASSFSYSHSHRDLPTSQVSGTSYRYSVLSLLLSLHMITPTLIPSPSPLPPSSSLHIPSISILFYLLRQINQPPLSPLLFGFFGFVDCNVL